MALTNPLVNSYKRLVPGYEAPVHIAWSSINRSPLIRIPAVRGTGRRIELRSPDPSANPYLILAVCLAAGLQGIKDGEMPAANVDRNIFEMTEAEKAEAGIESLPLNLFDAVKELEKDTFIQNVLGAHASGKYMEAKYAEWDEYRMQITQWELDQYLYKI
jgi:glutamine synthetase